MEEVKSEEVLLRVAIKKRSRGDTYRSIDVYLNNNCDDPELRAKIIRTVDELEESGQIVIEEEAFSAGSSNLNKVFSGLLILAGVFLGVLLWDKGYVATLPIIMVGAGITMMLKD